jgi:hypothetical protein
MRKRTDTTDKNPFHYGDLAIGEDFANREREVRALTADMRNGQNVVLFAPRRYGKSSLLRQVVLRLQARNEVLVAQVDLMTTPSKEKLAEKLASSIYENIASKIHRARDKALAVFGSLTIAPTVTVDPRTGTFGFSFAAGVRHEAIDSTLEKLLELPARLAAERGRRAALVIDEFQEILDIDPQLPALMRAIFQQQPEVAHVYLGSKRSMMRKLFDDVNEPFWRSAKQSELGVIDPEQFKPFIRSRFDRTDRGIDEEVLDGVLTVTAGHPYGTQELCYFLWEEVREGWSARQDDFERALTNVLHSENAHFARIWSKAVPNHRLILQVLAKEPFRTLSDEFRRRQGLPHDATVRKALNAMIDDELVLRDDRGYRIAEPFLAEWINRYQS